MRIGGTQPPSGGCELKQKNSALGFLRITQPPSGGCELKRHHGLTLILITHQPPSGGCELKPVGKADCYILEYPAAFGRL